MKHNYFIRYSLAGTSGLASFVIAIEIIPSSSSYDTMVTILSEIVKGHLINTQKSINMEELIIHVLTRIN